MNRPFWGSLFPDQPADLSAYRSLRVSVAGEGAQVELEVDGEVDTMSAGETAELPEGSRLVTLKSSVPVSVTWGGFRRERMMDAV